MPLKANKPNVVVTGASATAPVTISWNFPSDSVVLYESLRNVQQPDSYSLVSTPSSQTHMGSYTKDLYPGAVYTVLAFDHVAILSQRRPPIMEREAIDKVTVIAVQGSTQLITDKNEKVCGPYYRIIHVTSIVSHAMLEIGVAGNLRTDAAGFKSMTDPLLTIPSFTPLLRHRLTTDDLDKMDQSVRLNTLTM